MKKFLIIFLVFLLSYSFFLFALNPDKIVKKLKPKYQRWWNVVYWIITPEEKKIFLSLKTDRERDIFIEAFWKHRDPTPGTPENEYKDEIYRRFRYVNRYLKPLSPRPPWLTDMGRIYMILGEPISRDHFVMKNDVVPCEVWCYYGNPQYGLPAHFCLVFFKRRGSGEYELYNPVTDGPVALINTRVDMYDTTDYEKMYEKLRDIEPTLAPYSLSIIPGNIPTNYSPDIRTLIYFKNIAQYPYKMVDTTYAKNFLKYKGKVDIKYSANFIKSNFVSTITYNPDLGIFFYNYMISIHNLSLGSYRDRPYGNFELYGTIRDLKSGKEIFHYSKNFPLTFTDSQLNEIKSNGFAISDVIPVVPGTYKIEILLKNTVSFEFSYAERKVTISDVKNTPYISSLFAGYEKVEDSSLSLKPFKLGSLFLKPVLKNVVGTRDNLYFLIQLANISDSLKRSGFLHLIFDKKNVDKYQFLKEEKIPLSDFTGFNNLFYTKEILPKTLNAGNYRLEVALREGDRVFDRKIYSFGISPKSHVSKPVIFYKTLPYRNKFALYYFYGEELKNKGEILKAMEFAKKGISLNPQFPPLYELTLECYFLNRDFSGARDFLKSVPGTINNYKISYYRGRVCEFFKNYEDAIKYYKESLSLKENNFLALKYLGKLLLKLGKKKDGISLLKRALEIRPSDEKLKNFITEVTNSKN